MAHTDAHTHDIGLECPMSRKSACVQMDAPTAITSMAHNGANTHMETMRICDAKLTARLLHAMLPQASVHFRTTLRQNLSAPGVSVWVPALRPNLSARGGGLRIKGEIQIGEGLQIGGAARQDPF